MAGYQVMPRLTPDEYAELEQSIIENGVQVPITVDQHGVIVDGHHRDEIARKHALHCPRVTADGDEAKLRGLAFSLNLHRRHLDTAQKRVLLTESIKSDPQLSNSAHAKRTGTTHPTAATVRRGLEDSGEVEKFTTRVGSDGVEQPASKPPTFVCVSCEERRPLDEHTEVPEGRLCNDCIEEYDAPPELAEPLNDNRFINADELDALNQPEPKPEPLPEPAAPKRRPITDAFFDAVYDLSKLSERLTRLSDDDRTVKNKGQIAESHLSDLTRSRDALQRVIDKLTD